MKYRVLRRAEDRRSSEIIGLSDQICSVCRHLTYVSRRPVTATACCSSCQQPLHSSLLGLQIREGLQWEVLLWRIDSIISVESACRRQTLLYFSIWRSQADLLVGSVMRYFILHLHHFTYFGLFHQKWPCGPMFVRAQLKISEYYALERSLLPGRNYGLKIPYFIELFLNLWFKVMGPSKDAVRCGI